MPTFQVPPEHIAAAWAVGGKDIERAAKHGDLNIPEVVAKIGAFEYQFWLIWADDYAGAIVTAIEVHPTHKALRIIAAGGDGSTTESAIETLEAFARAEGCTELRMWGRKGWKRKLRGWRLTHVAMVKELNDAVR